MAHLEQLDELYGPGVDEPVLSGEHRLAFSRLRPKRSANALEVEMGDRVPSASSACWRNHNDAHSLMTLCGISFYPHVTVLGP